MSHYEVLMHREADKELKKLTRQDKKAAAAIQAIIDSLGADPRPARAERLTHGAFRKAKGKIYKIPAGLGYRVVYAVYDNELEVMVVAAGSRENIYATVATRLR